MKTHSRRRQTIHGFHLQKPKAASVACALTGYWTPSPRGARSDRSLAVRQAAIEGSVPATLDGLNAIRKLKQHGVEVYFDLEELKSFQPDFELHYSIRAAIAHGERENIHDNIAMSINQKILDGTSSIYSRPCYGYRKSEDGSLLIVPEEAETVRLIFNLYLSGYSIIGIIHELESRSISSPTGKPKWCRRAIDTLLSNEKYRGGSTATTVLMSDAPQSKQRARYLFSDHHEAIIDEKTFIAVAKEKQRRCNIEVDENGVHRKKTRYTAKIRVSGSLKEE